MQFPTLLKGLYIPVIIWWISFLSGFLGNQTASRVQEVILSGDNPPSPRPFYLIKSSLANVVRYHHFVPWIGWFMNFSSSKICIPHLLPTCNAWFKKQHLCVIMCEVIMCDSSLTKSKSFWRVAQCLSLFSPLVLKPRSVIQRSLESLLLACLYNISIYQYQILVYKICWPAYIIHWYIIIK